MVLLSHLNYGQVSDHLKNMEELRKKINEPVVLPKNERVKLRITKELSYQPARDNSQKMDVYQAMSSIRGKLPIVVFIHGKTPLQTNPKNWGGYKSWAELTASKGYVAVVFTQSLSKPGTGIEEAASDLGDALAYIIRNHEVYNADTSRIALIAYSAGVPLLSYALIHNRSNIKCIAAFYGYMDIRNIDLWVTESPATLRKFSLIDYLSPDKNFPPVFIAKAGKENNNGLNETIDSFLAKSSGNDINLSFANHPLGVHGFDTQNNDGRSKEIIESLFVFLQYHLKDE